MSKKFQRNATAELSGRHNVHTGRADSSKMGSIQRFNDLDHFPFYTGECAKLKGSTGEFFSLDQSRDSIYLFTPDMCRSIPFDYKEDVDVHGLTGYRFVAGKRAVDNGSEFGENSCYSAGSEESVPSGVMNISACRYSSPIFMSYPHFYEADESLLNGVGGLHPEKEKYQSYITLDPVSSRK
jgi:scavenger receptor class B protein 1